MNGYIKYFDNGDKNMSFVTDDEKVYDKHNEIWEVIRKLLKTKFTANPVRDDRYLVAKLKIFNKVNRTTFTNDFIPFERLHYNCIPVIDIDSVLKIDNKRAYPQAYLEQCKYKLKKEGLQILLIMKLLMMKLVILMIMKLLEKKDKKNNWSIKIIIMEIVLMNDNAIIPTRASKESAGLDLHSSIDVDIEVGSIKKLNTGICISLPENS